VVEAFRPSKETEDQVRNWLIDSGIPEQRITHTENKAWLAFFATASEAEKLLYTHFHEYEDSETGGVIPACDQYHVPKHIRQHIDYISPGIKLMAPVESLLWVNTESSLEASTFNNTKVYQVRTRMISVHATN
jgi:tripeptidyl-peptidase-1